MTLCTTWIFPNGVLAQAFSCTDVNGKTLFTDDKRKCHQDNATEVNLDSHPDTRVNFRYPQRNYETVKSEYSIRIETPLNSKERHLYLSGVDKLEAALNEIFSVLPLSSHVKLKLLNFYIMRGPKSPLGGEKSGMRYIPHAGVARYSLHDAHWKNAVIIYSVDNLMYLSNLWTKKALTHEIGHAWHTVNWKTKRKYISEAWMKSRQSSLYLSVRDIKGNIKSPAYASTNDREYFAELSAMYFVGGDYYPFDRAGLRTYDPEGFMMVEDVWGL